MTDHKTCHHRRQKVIGWMENPYRPAWKCLDCGAESEGRSLESTLVSPESDGGALDGERR